MDKARFEQVKQCGAMLAIASRLYKRRLITDAEYHKLTEKLQKKYRTVAGSVAGLSLTLNSHTEKVPGKEDFSNK